MTKSQIPVVHLDASVRFDLLSILQPGDLRCGHSLSLTHEASRARARSGQALRPFDQGGRSFKENSVQFRHISVLQ